jgi:DHA1 family bicyclomycin/chloramphenicol resistance-like MFS transporter
MEQTNRDGAATAGKAVAPGMPGFGEFVVLVSSLMGLTALSIDIMLPALEQISRDYAVIDENRRQLVITLYLAGFAAGQLLYGPLSDRFGRKPVLLAGLAFYAAASLVCLLADSFELLIAARAVQGFANASPRILALATVRDIYGGRRMAEVMSFVMMVFIIVPILAPSLGGLILMCGDWHLIFAFLAVISLLLLALTGWRLPETHPAEKREPLSPAWLTAAAGRILTTPQTFGYAVAMGLMLGSLMSYVTTSQQVFIDVYHTGRWFPILFGVVAAALAVASFTNSRLVMRLGMHRISHTALLGFLATALVHLGIDQLIGPPPLALFVLLISLNLFFFGLTMPNFNALAMEPMAAIAGTASSFVGALTTGMSATLGWLIGSFFDGTVAPLLTGFALCSLTALAVVLTIEHGRLFRASH